MPCGLPCTQDDKDRLFELICSGASLLSASELMGVSRPAAANWWRDADAMKPMEGPGDGALGSPGALASPGGRARPGALACPAPTDRPGGRGYRLSLDERIGIMCGRRAGKSQAESGRLLGRDRSVVCREIQRNLNPNGISHAAMAHSRARVRADRPKPFKLIDNPRLCASGRLRPRTGRCPVTGEGDLIIGTGSRSAIGTPVERSTRFTILLQLPGRHTSEATAEAMAAARKQLPADLLCTVTWDRGTEMAKHRQITMELGAPVFFCEPHSHWQLGTN